MWTLLILQDGNWVKQQLSENLNECLEGKKNLTEKGNIYIFYTGDFPIDNKERTEILNKIIAVNENEISRVTIGLDLSSSVKDAKLSTCPGNCFCVQANGKQRCETKYCNESVCWWVPCGYSC